MTNGTDRTTAVINTDKPQWHELFKLRKEILSFAVELKHQGLIAAIRSQDDALMLFILENTPYRLPESVVRASSLRMQWGRLEKMLGVSTVARLTIDQLIDQLELSLGGSDNWIP